MDWLPSILILHINICIIFKQELQYFHISIGRSNMQLKESIEKLVIGISVMPKVI